MAGAEIVATDNNGNQYSAISSDYGVYAIIGLPAGVYRVRCELDTYIANERTDISVSLSKTTPNIDFVLDPGGTISGMVTSALDGTPIQGARLLAASEFGEVLGSETFEQGDYSISGLATGVWEVTPEAAGWVAADAVTLSVTAPNTFVQDFVLSPAANISGTVTNLSGQSIENAAVMANGETYIGMGITDDIGDYLVDFLPSGQYTVEVKADGYIGQVLPGLSLAEGEKVANLTFSLEEGKTVSGLVTEADGSTAIPEAEISFHANSGEMHLTASEADGSFTIDTLAPGIYLVEVTAGDRLPHYQMIEVPESGNVPSLHVSLAEGGTLSGRVTLADGSTPVSGAQVLALADGVLVNFSFTDANGDYVIKPLKSDIYTLVVQHASIVDSLLSKLAWRHPQRWW